MNTCGHLQLVLPFVTGMNGAETPKIVDLEKENIEIPTVDGMISNSETYSETATTLSALDERATSNISQNNNLIPTVVRNNNLTALSWQKCSKKQLQFRVPLMQFVLSVFKTFAVDTNCLICFYNFRFYVFPINLAGTSFCYVIVHFLWNMNFLFYLFEMKRLLYSLPLHISWVALTEAVN